MNLTARQFVPAIDAAIYRPDRYIISTPAQFSRIRRNRSRRRATGGREKNYTRQLSRLCSFPFRLLVVESILIALARTELF